MVSALEGFVRRTLPHSFGVVFPGQPPSLANRNTNPGDGHENALDVCFGQANPGWDPRTPNPLSSQDADGDGLPAPCDPNDNEFNSDQDGDGWVNRIDNCPRLPTRRPAGPRDSAEHVPAR